MTAWANGNVVPLRLTVTFEGRQGRNGRTHLVSPAMAAAAAVFGKFMDIRKVSLNA